MGQGGAATHAGDRVARYDDGDRLHPSRGDHGYHLLHRLAGDLRTEAALVPAGPIVDLGCGGMPYRPLFGSDANTYVGLDVSARHGDPDLVGLADHLPVRDGGAAVALSTQNLEHVPDPGVVLAEARRILRPGGVLLLSTHGVWVHHPDPADYWRWTEQGLVRLVEQAGFVVERVHHQGELVVAAAGLALYPMAKWSRSRSRLRRWLARAVIAPINVVAGAVDRVFARLSPRHLASPNYLIVARVPGSEDHR